MHKDLYYKRTGAPADSSQPESCCFLVPSIKGTMKKSTIPQKNDARYDSKQSNADGFSGQFFKSG